jgi:hypothetical protein
LYTICDWFKSTNKDKKDVAIAHREEISSTTPLHAACRHPDPPLDIIKDFLSCSTNVAKIEDNDAWIPLNYG